MLSSRFIRAHPRDKMGLERRYTVVKKVADGGMAEIFLAHLTGAEGFARMVILKRILPVFSIDPHFRNMLVDEAHIAMSLHHSNIVQVTDLGEERGRYFLALELVDGWDLATVVSRAAAAAMPLHAGLGLYVISEVCRALAYAHGQTRDGKPLGIVHRDISPQNVLISAQGEVKLTDFGIAKALGKRERTQTGVIKGKLDFMSPEQAAGAPLDPRSDIFSVGTMLYVLATGKRPFESDGQLETLIRVQNAQFTPPEVAAPAVSPRIAAIIRRAMQKAPSDRYGSADEMLRDVEDVLRGDFHSVGQSELKDYLEQLGRKDHVPPISRAPGLPQEPEEEEEAALATEATRPEGQRTPGTLAMGLRRSGQTLAMDATVRRPTPEAAGALPARPLTDESTEHVSAPRPRPRRFVRSLMMLFTLGMAGLALYFFAPKTGQKLLDEGRERLARTGLPLAGDKPPRPAAREPAEPPRREPERSAEPPPADPPEPLRGRPGLVNIRFSSRPNGAVVRNGSAKIGTTPFTMSLKPGSALVIKFSKSGYASETRRLSIGQSNAEVKVELSRVAARRSRRR
jgi:serine/threonine-protein kinase